MLTALESAETPLEAVSVVGRLSLCRAIELPVEIGRDILKIVMNGDTGEMLSSTANHLN